MEKITILTGAGISQESGLSTFRGNGGLWEGHDVNRVSSLAGWSRDPGAVLDFYNKFRALEVEPNAAHMALAELEDFFDVVVLTQNIDLLHEEAGSSNVVHLHGQLNRARSVNSKIAFPYDKDINVGDLAPDGYQLRPDIVWFGEEIQSRDYSLNRLGETDIFIVIGTSMAVKPASGFVYCVPKKSQKYVVDLSPRCPPTTNVELIQAYATVGVPQLVKKLIEKSDKINLCHYI